MAIHELKIEPKFFNPIKSGQKTFEVRKDDRGYQYGDILYLKEYSNGEYTGNEVAVEVTYMSLLEQKEGYVVLAIQLVPKSFIEYLSLTNKEKKVFEEVITHIHLYGLSNRDTANLCWDIIRELIGNDDLSDKDREWYREYWNEEE